MVVVWGGLSRRRRVGKGKATRNAENGQPAIKKRDAGAQAQGYDGAFWAWDMGL